jgi:hypothetical protein
VENDVTPGLPQGSPDVVAAALLTSGSRMLPEFRQADREVRTLIALGTVLGALPKREVLHNCS